MNKNIYLNVGFHRYTITLAIKLFTGILYTNEMTYELCTDEKLKNKKKVMEHDTRHQDKNKM